MQESEPLASLADLRRLTPATVRKVPYVMSRRVRSRLGMLGGGIRSVSDIEVTPRLESFVSILGSLPAGRLLDLGAGHGSFSSVAAAMGWEVTAQDVRSVRFPTRKRGVRWVTGDVLDLRIEPGEYDLVLCLGLLYHLDLPDQLTLLRKLSGSMLLLDTHASTEQDHGSNPHSRVLGDVVEVDGYVGRYYSEMDGLSEDDRKTVPTASWGNERSFWATKESLVQMLYDCGFATVLTDEHEQSYARAFQLCLPSRRSVVAIDQGSPRRGPIRQTQSLLVGLTRRG